VPPYEFQAVDGGAMRRQGQNVSVRITTPGAGPCVRGM